MIVAGSGSVISVDSFSKNSIRSAKAVCSGSFTRETDYVVWLYSINTPRAELAREECKYARTTAEIHYDRIWFDRMTQCCRIRVHTRSISEHLTVEVKAIH